MSLGSRFQVNDNGEATMVKMQRARIKRPNQGHDADLNLSTYTWCTRNTALRFYHVLPRRLVYLDRNPRQVHHRPI